MQEEIIHNEPTAVVEKTEQPPPTGASNAQAPQETPRENHIPISRAEEMWRRREEKVRAEYAERIRSYEEKLRSYEPQRAGSAPEMLAPDRQASRAAEPRAEAEIRKMRAELLATNYSVQWESFKNTHRRILSVPGARAAVEAAFRAAFGSGQNPAQAVQPLVREFNAQADERDRIAKEQRARQLAPHRRVVPGGKGAAGGLGSAQPGRKPGVAERIKDAVRQRREWSE